jgi:hypothetical protein
VSGAQHIICFEIFGVTFPALRSKKHTQNRRVQNDLTLPWEIECVRWAHVVVLSVRQLGESTVTAAAAIRTG